MRVQRPAEEGAPFSDDVMRGQTKPEQGLMNKTG